MSPAVRGAVSTLVRRQLAAVGASLALLAILVWLPFGLGDYRAPDIGPMAAIIVSGVAALTYFGSIAALLLRTRSLWHARAKLLADLENGTVIEFGGIVGAAPHADPDQRRLLDIGVLIPGSAREQRIAVLPVTHQVVHRDRKLRWRALPVRVRNVAAAPAFAMRAEVPRGFAVPIDRNSELVRRSLSSSERAEIQRYIRMVQREYPKLALNALLAVISVMMLVGWFRSSPHRFIGLLAPLVGLGFAIHNGREFVFALRRMWQFSQDLATGWVLTLQPRLDDEPEPGEGMRPGARRPEFLAHSGVLWTENGRPASWRDHV